MIMTALGLILGIIPYLISKILLIFLWIVSGMFSFFVPFALGTNTGGTKNFFDSDFIKAAWVITRDVANMFLVFIILYIAISTILKMSSFTMKQTLSKILIAAVMLNFSFTITTFAIDISNALAVKFYDAATQGQNLGLVIAGFSQFQNITDHNAGAPDKDGYWYRGSGENREKCHAEEGETELNEFGYMQPTDSVCVADKDTTEKTTPDPSSIRNLVSGEPLKIIATSVGDIIFTIVLIVSLLYALYLFMHRTIVFTFLIVLSPLAFLGMAVPGVLGSKAGEWRSKLIENMINAPTFMFFIYLAVKMRNSGNFFCNPPNSSACTKGSMAGLVGMGMDGTKVNDAGLSSFAVILNMVIMIGFVLGALISAKKLGAAGAGTAMGYLTSMKKKTAEYSSRGARRFAGKVGLGSEKLQNKVASIPLAGGMMAKGLQGINSANLGQVSKLEGEMKGKSAAELNTLLRSTGDKDLFKRAAIMNTLASQGQLHTADAGVLKKTFKGMGAYGWSGAAVGARADLALEAGMDAKNVARSITSSEQWHNMDVSGMTSNSEFMGTFLENASPSLIRGILDIKKTSGGGYQTSGEGGSEQMLNYIAKSGGADSLGGNPTLQAYLRSAPVTAVLGGRSTPPPAEAVSRGEDVSSRRGGRTQRPVPRA